RRSVPRSSWPSRRSPVPKTSPPPSRPSPRIHVCSSNTTTRHTPLCSRHLPPLSPLPPRALDAPMTRLARSLPALVASAALTSAPVHAAHAQDGPTVLRASSAIDRRGRTLSNVDIVVENGKIARIVAAGSGPSNGRLIDLRGRTLLPGLIDAHSHLSWYFN